MAGLRGPISVCLGDQIRVRLRILICKKFQDV
uniref:Uncharacterized protein n=1 Tax=Rhizophora mucronata TaxID=61149 RepID=A0A2P2PC58_RHIMU